MQKYVQVSLLGMSCYSDAFIADTDSRTLFFASLFGRPGLVKAIGAAILAGRSVHFGRLALRRVSGYSYRTLTQSLGYGLTHKVFLCEPYFTGNQARIVVGEDKKRAFEFLDSVVSTPLKDEWADVLWDRVFEPKSLFGFGTLDGKDLADAYLVTLNKTVDEVDRLVLEGIRAGELN